MSCRGAASGAGDCDRTDFRDGRDGDRDDDRGGDSGARCCHDGDRDGDRDDCSGDRDGDRDDDCSGDRDGECDGDRGGDRYGGDGAEPGSLALLPRQVAVPLNIVRSSRCKTSGAISEFLIPPKNSMLQARTFMYNWLNCWMTAKSSCRGNSSYLKPIIADG